MISVVDVNGVYCVKYGKGLTSYILPKGGLYGKEGSSESRG